MPTEAEELSASQAPATAAGAATRDPQPPRPVREAIVYRGWDISEASGGGWIGRHDGIDLEDRHPVWLTPQEVRDWIEDFESAAFTDCADALQFLLASSVKDDGPLYPTRNTLAVARAALERARALGFLTMRYRLGRAV